MTPAPLARFKKTHGAPGALVVVDAFENSVFSTQPPTEGLYVFDRMVFGIRPVAGGLYYDNGLTDLGEAVALAERLEAKLKRPRAEKAHMTRADFLDKHGNSTEATAAEEAKITADHAEAELAIAAYQAGHSVDSGSHTP